MKSDRGGGREVVNLKEFLWILGKFKIIFWR